MSKNIIFIAPPAAGKGSQANLLSNELNIAHISTGDLLREEAKNNVELQKQIEAGILISDELVTKLLKKKLQSNDCKNGYILDGYPRNLKQAHILENLLDELGMPIKYVFYLDIDKDIACKRACGRLGCPKCGRIYNKYFSESKPKVDNLCDFCHIELFHRDDDNKETFENRFDTFLKNTKQLIKYYEERHLLCNFDGSLNKELVHKQILDVLNKKG